MRGTTREEVTRVQARLQQAGLIEVTRKFIRIVDPTGLEATSR